MGKLKKPCSNHKFKISTPSWNDTFDLPDGSYPVSDMQGYFGYIFKEKHNKKIDNPPIKIYVNKTENRITFEIKTGYYLELLTPESMKARKLKIKMVEMYHI